MQVAAYLQDLSSLQKGNCGKGVKSVFEREALALKETERVKAKADAIGGVVEESDGAPEGDAALESRTSSLVGGGDIDKALALRKKGGGKQTRAQTSKVAGSDGGSVGEWFPPASVTGAAKDVKPYYIMWGFSQKTQLAGAAALVVKAPRKRVFLSVSRTSQTSERW